MMRAFFSICIILGIASGVSAQPFPYETPYQQAVPQFLDEISQAVKDIGNLSDIAAWEEDTRNRLPEFLDDFTSAVITFSDQPFGTYDLAPFEGFVNKWDAVINTYPDKDHVVSLVEPVLNKYLSGLPQLRPALPADTPFQNHYELYQQMEALNPYALGSLFHLEPLENELKHKTREETLWEQTLAGIKTVTIIRRLTSITINGVLVKYELIEDGVVVDRFVQQKDTSLLHETLRRMKADNGDPQVIAMLENLVSLIDENLKRAFDNGLLDPEVYHYLYGGEPRFIGLHPHMYLFPLENQVHPWSASLSGVSAASAPDRDLNAALKKFSVTMRQRASSAQNTLRQINHSASQLPELAEKKIGRSANEYAGGIENAFAFWFVYILIPLLAWMLGYLIRYALTPLSRHQ